MTEYYPIPKVVFQVASCPNFDMGGILPQVDDRFILQFAMAHYDGCFTMTGFRDYHKAALVQHCEDLGCGKLVEYDSIEFNSDEEMKRFMVSWKDFNDALHDKYDDKSKYEYYLFIEVENIYKLAIWLEEHKITKWNWSSPSPLQYTIHFKKESDLVFTKLGFL